VVKRGRWETVVKSVRAAIKCGCEDSEGAFEGIQSIGGIGEGMS
jgi:hypothetical protein